MVFECFWQLVSNDKWAVHLLKLMEYIAYSMIRSTVASMHPHGNLQKKRTIFMCSLPQYWNKSVLSLKLCGLDVWLVADCIDWPCQHSLGHLPLVRSCKGRATIAWLEASLQWIHGCSVCIQVVFNSNCFHDLTHKMENVDLWLAAMTGFSFDIVEPMGVKCTGWLSFPILLRWDWNHCENIFQPVQKVKWQMSANAIAMWLMASWCSPSQSDTSHQCCLHHHLSMLGVAANALESFSVHESAVPSCPL